jgi:hypothetical protein
MVEEISLDTLYNAMIQFIPEDDPLPDEIAAHAAAMEEYQRGEFVQPGDIKWD